MTRNLYIDTNVYLTFFHFSNEDLNELKKLVALIKTDNIKLFVPEQTYNEFHRNRETKIADSLEKLRTTKFENAFPSICHAYAEYDEMQKAIRQFESNKAQLLKKMIKDAETASLMADDVLNQLLDKATFIETTPEILNNAVARFNTGNPPGKDRSYGDAINWETLLHNVPNSSDLYFISDDKDYYSQLNKANFNHFLLTEWRNKKNAELHYHKKLSSFFKAHYPDIEITSETEKEIIIRNLFEAYSFQNAKDVIKRLLEFSGFSAKQLGDITAAFIKNNQIYNIRTSYVIKRGCMDIIEENEDRIDPEVYQAYKRRYDR